MGKFESYITKHRYDPTQFPMDAEEKQRDMGIGEFWIDYDAEQFEEHLQEKMQGHSFQDRYLYYFDAAGYMDAKRERYKKLSEGRGGITQFAKAHGYHSARKRKKSARKASEAFGKAAQYANDIRYQPAPDSLYDRFLQRETVMRLMLEGRMNAAETKSISKMHEKYLQGKAKITSLTVLLELLDKCKNEADAQADMTSKMKLLKKEEALEKELAKARIEFRESQITADQKWVQSSGFDGMSIERTMSTAEDKVTKGNALTCLIMGRLKKQEKDGLIGDFPLVIPRLDSYGNPINKAEKEKAEWNQAYQSAGPNLKATMDMDVIARVEKFKLPDLAELDKVGMEKLFHAHPVEYYEMLIKAPRFLTDEIRKGGTYADYARQNPEFAAKVNVLQSLGALLEYTIKRAHVDPFTGKFYSHADYERLKPSLDAVKDSFGIDVAYRELFNAHRMSLLPDDDDDDDGDYDDQQQVEREEEQEDKKLDGQDDGQRVVKVDVQEEEEEQEKQKPIEEDTESMLEYGMLQEERNPDLTLEDYKIYKEMFDSGYAARDPHLVMDVFSMNLERKQKGLSKITLQDHLSAFMSSLRYNGRGEPASAEDRRILEQNKRWLKAWQEDDEKAKRDIVDEQLPKLFDGFEFPDPAAEPVTVWIERMIKEKPFKFNEMLRKATAIDNLAEEMEYIYDYEKAHLDLVFKLDLAHDIAMIARMQMFAYHSIDTFNQGIAGPEVGSIAHGAGTKEAQDSFEHSEKLAKFTADYATHWAELQSHKTGGGTT